MYAPRLGYILETSLSSRPRMPKPELVRAPSKVGRPPINRKNYPVGRTTLGQSLTTGIAPLTATFTPSMPSAPAAAPSGGGILDSIANLVNVWNNRPQVLKDIRFKVNPTQAMSALQTVVPAKNVSGAVSLLNKWGLTPQYKGVTVTPGMAETGYTLAGVQWQSYIPWILGGGAVLVGIYAFSRKR